MGLPNNEEQYTALMTLIRRHQHYKHPVPDKIGDVQAGGNKGGYALHPMGSHGAASAAGDMPPVEQ